MDITDQTRALITRLARLEAADGWTGDLNPAQRVALDYLAKANRFSRSPSHVADFLGSTRGTTSQTLKALVRKGYVAEEPATADKRSISYELTDTGREVTSQHSLLRSSLDGLPDREVTRLAETLQNVLGAATRQNGSKPFGICRTCRHFRAQNGGGHCKLLQVALHPHEINQICHEQVPQ